MSPWTRCARAHPWQVDICVAHEYVPGHGMCLCVLFVLLLGLMCGPPVPVRSRGAPHTAVFFRFNVHLLSSIIYAKC